MHVGVVGLRETDYSCDMIVVGLEGCLKGMLFEMLVLVEQEKDEHTCALYRLSFGLCPATSSTSAGPCYIQNSH